MQFNSVAFAMMVGCLIGVYLVRGFIPQRHKKVRAWVAIVLVDGSYFFLSVFLATLALGKSQGLLRLFWEIVLVSGFFIGILFLSVKLRIHALFVPHTSSGPVKGKTLGVRNGPQQSNPEWWRVTLGVSQTATWAEVEHAARKRAAEIYESTQGMAKPNPDVINNFRAACNEAKKAYGK